MIIKLLFSFGFLWLSGRCELVDYVADEEVCVTVGGVIKHTEGVS